MLRQLPDTGLTRLSGPSPLPWSEREVSGDGETYSASSASEPAIAVDPSDSRRQVVGWQQDRWSYGASRAAVFAVTGDGGINWRRVIPQITVCTGGPYFRIANVWLSFAPDGRVYATMMAIGGIPYRSAIIVITSGDGGQTWDGPVEIASDSEDAFFNDKPGITSDPYQPGLAYLAWNRYDKAANRNSLMFSRSADGGRTWDPPCALYQPPAGQGTIGNQIIALPDGALLDIFHRGPFAPGAPEGRAHGPDLIGGIRSTDGGTTWSGCSAIAQVELGSPVLPGTNVPVIGAAMVPGIAADASGRVFVAWVDARLSESASAVALSVSGDGGMTWTVPRRVNATPDSPPGGPGQALCPAVAVAPDGTVAVTYYDMREADGSRTGPAATSQWISTCPDGGTSARSQWREQRLSGPFDLSTAVRWFGGPYLGTYTGLAAIRDGFVSAFVMSGLDTPGTQDVYLRRVSAR